MLHGRIEYFAKLNIGSLFNVWIDYMCFVFSLCCWKLYKIDINMYLEYISICDKWLNFLCIGSASSFQTRRVGSMSTLHTTYQYYFSFFHNIFSLVTN
jgi:hypothetical protein